MSDSASRYTPKVARARELHVHATAWDFGETDSETRARVRELNAAEFDEAFDEAIKSARAKGLRDGWDEGEEEGQRNARVWIDEDMRSNPYDTKDNEY